MDTGLLVIRLAVGLLMAGHGAQKLFGWFGGHGLAGTARAFEGMGYRPGRLHATLAGASEFAAGLLLAAGFLTPLAAAAFVGLMVNAIVAVHGRNGLWITRGGAEYALVLAVVAAGLAFTGPGDASVDAAIGLDLSGVTAGVLALALGMVSGLAVVSMRKPAPASSVAAEGRGLATREEAAARR